MSKSTTSTRPWRFFQAGGFEQVRLESGGDLMSLDQLDQKLWVALACPTAGLEMDPKTLALIDTDGDGRVRAPELIAAVKWAGGMLKNPEDIALADAADAVRIFSNTTFNGDGIIIPESAPDDATRAVINDIMACLGAVPDRSGKPGIDQSRADAFFAECAGFDGWSKQAEADAAGILPAGAATAAAASARRMTRAPPRF
jgi:hypothetical protein